MQPVFGKLATKRVGQSDEFIFALRINVQMQTVHNSVMHNWVYMDININNSRYIFLLVNSSFNITAIFVSFHIAKYTISGYFRISCTKIYGYTLVI